MIRPKPRVWKPILLAVAGGAGAFLTMANQDRLPHGALWGGLCVTICVLGIFWACGLLRAQDGEPIPLAATALGVLPGEPGWASPGLAAGIGALVLVAGTTLLGASHLPWLIALALGLCLPAAMRRPGLLVFVIASALYLPLLGSLGLWDPWETHYGEVAREILSRDDWISLWWAQDQWFWSKPILIFWAEALVWSASGLGYLPDSNFQHAEWVLRLPTYGFSVLGLLFAYGAMAVPFGRRAGVLGALVLATTPYYAMLTRQAITDMPCVGAMLAAIALLLLAVHEDPERRVRSYRIGPLCVSAQELVLGAFLLLCVPQILYLASRNVTFIDGMFAWHRDEFMLGSAHNGSVPGNPALADAQPRFNALLLQPMAQALLWSVATTAVVFALRRERRAQPLYMMGFYIFCALAFMAKGIPGFAVPGLVAALYLLACNRWSLLFHGKLRVALGSLVMVSVSLPWFVAMYVRHGSAFTDRILVHDHLNRLTSGVHGDNGSARYFIEQLGYGMFPWIALAPLALGGWLYLRPGRDSLAGDPLALRQRETGIALALWFAATFTLYSAMVTKFHHYVFPAAPPAGLLIGLVLDRMLPSTAQATASLGRRVGGFGLALLAPLPIVLGVAGFRGDVRGILPDDVPATARATWVWHHAWNPVLCLGLCALGIGLLASAMAVLRSPRAPRDPALAVGLLASAVLCAFMGRDLSWTTQARPAGNERLIQLFIYNYDRAFPTQFDYRPILSGFAIVATVLIAAAAIERIRPVLALGIVGLSLLFAFFCLDVYMFDLTPHWSQRGLIERYYRERKGPEEPLVAWQMNWKGENFYTGNKVAVFPDLKNKEISDWIDGHKGTTAYLLLEHHRLPRLKTLLGSRAVASLTSERDNNKFVLVRVLL
jgi:4-amino-4-deoxy-L-arabinose transferase-like glycosyltransferase